jgi:hypothetical protein
MEQYDAGKISMKSFLQNIALLYAWMPSKNYPKIRMRPSSGCPGLIKLLTAFRNQDTTPSSFNLEDRRIYVFEEIKESNRVALGISGMSSARVGNPMGFNQIKTCQIRRGRKIR